MPDNTVITNLVNVALYRLGEAPITSLEEGTETADAANRIYPEVRDDMLSRATWPFATVRQQLSRLAGVTPASDFDYYYLLPTDPYCLRVIELDITLRGQLFRRETYVNPVDSTDQKGVIATDATAVTLTYLGRVSEGIWPPAFIRLVSLSMAVELSQTITGKASLSKLLSDERERQLIVAKDQIAHEGTPRLMPLPTTYIDARGEGSVSAPITYGDQF